MSPFWLSNPDLLPARAREQVRKRPQRSPEEYEKSREKVKEGVREAGEQREQNEQTAEVMLYIEMNEEELKEQLKEENLSDVIADFGSYDTRKQHQMMQAFGEARFDLSVGATDEGNPKISMQIDLPEGNVSDRIQLNQSLQDALIARATGGAIPCSSCGEGQLVGEEQKCDKCGYVLEEQ